MTRLSDISTRNLEMSGLANRKNACEINFMFGNFDVCKRLF